MSRDYQLTRFRPPPELREKISAMAKEHRRSLNSEIVFGLEFYARHIEKTKKTEEAQPGSTPSSVSQQ
ncbi:Arc family DNA-binding protein [Gluconobacter oxydans]|uniref:Arc family DNA-binding protein n=1 Tax=Gluconobacter oxydans TaxID=442 RepID=UPI00346400BF